MDAQVSSVAFQENDRQGVEFNQKIMGTSGIPKYTWCHWRLSFLAGHLYALWNCQALKVSEDKVWKVLRAVPFDIPAETNDIGYASLLEAKIYMTNQLLKDTDYMGMWHGVEVRVPFLDIEMLKNVHTLAPSLRYKNLWPKYLLTASSGNVLPHEIVFREKKGFTFPFALWMKRSSKRFRALMPAGHEVNVVAEDFQRGQAHWSKCWSLAVLQQFSNK